MLLGKISVAIVVHIIAIGVILNWLNFKSSLRLVFALYFYFVFSYYSTAVILGIFPEIWNPIEAGILDPNKIDPAYK